MAAAQNQYRHHSKNSAQRRPPFIQSLGCSPAAEAFSWPSADERMGEAGTFDKFATSCCFATLPAQSALNDSANSSPKEPPGKHVPVSFARSRRARPAAGGGPPLIRH